MLSKLMVFLFSCAFALASPVAEKATLPPAPRLLKVMPAGGIEGSRILLDVVNLGENPQKLVVEIRKPSEVKKVSGEKSDTAPVVFADAEAPAFLTKLSGSEAEKLEG